ASAATAEAARDQKAGRRARRLGRLPAVPLPPGRTAARGGHVRRWLALRLAAAAWYPVAGRADRSAWRPAAWLRIPPAPPGRAARQPRRRSLGLGSVVAPAWLPPWHWGGAMSVAAPATETLRWRRSQS